MQNRFAVLASIAVLALLAACTSVSEDDTTTTSPSVDPSITSTTSGEPSPPASETEDQLVILGADIPAQLDLDMGAPSHINSQTGIVQLGDPLIYHVVDSTNPDGIEVANLTEFEGRLAESWEFDEEDLTWTFNLRQNVVGCDGQTFNADDVIYSYQRFKSVSGTVPVQWFWNSTASVDGFDASVFDGETELGDEVTKIDDYTIQIRQSESNVLFDPIMATYGTLIYDKETMEANATPEDPWAHEYVNNVDLPGFGPYCLESWDKGREFVVTANDDYYLGAPPIGRVVYRAVPESSSRSAALQRGEAHLIEDLSPREFAALADVEGVTVGGHFGVGSWYLLADHAVEPFDDVLVRRALAHAIPYDRLIDSIWGGGIGQKWQGLIVSNFAGYTEVPTQYSYDPDLARELLAEAGYPGGEGLDGFDSEVWNLKYVAELEAIIGPAAIIIQQALGEVGFPVELAPIPRTQFNDRKFVQLDIGFALDSERPLVNSAVYPAFPFWLCTSLANWVHYCNPELDALVLQARAETDASVRQALLDEMQDMLMQDLPWIPIVEVKSQWAFASNLSGVAYHPDVSLRWRELEFTSE